MLATQPALNCILSESPRQKAMKNGSNSDHLIFTLEDDISDQVLKSKSDDDATSGSSSVALWIKSLKESHFDDSRQDHHSYTGSSSDHDDLQLGAEAIDLRRKHKTHKHFPPLSRDSDSDSSYNRCFSWTGRRTFLTNRLSYDRSLDSDTSGLSSVTSVSSLLTARESDPEDVLKGLGFLGPSVFDRIPDRFIITGTICDGVDSRQFLCSVNDDSDDLMYTNPDIPPWVMTRFNDIPAKFWNQKEDLLESSYEREDVPSINEPSDKAIEETPTRPPKTFSSKYGTYLEPVTEEVELSSQGSAVLSPMKNISFESTRSTLKANSQDGPENMAKIPSLCDLWQNTENEEVNSEAFRSEEHGITSDDTENNVPASNIPGEVDQGCNGDWIDKNRDDNSVNPWSSTLPIAEIQPMTAADNPVNPCSWTPAIADIQDIPAITSSQWSSPQADIIPSLSAYLTDNNTPASENHRESSEVESGPTDIRCLEVINNEKLTELNTENNMPDSSTILTPKHPKLNIPILTISAPVEKSRKISTVNAPDIDKLLPILYSDKSEKTKTRKQNPASKGTISCDIPQNKATQMNMYDRQQWAALANKTQPQISFSNKEKLRRKLSRSRKTVGTKVTVNEWRKTHQLTLPCESNVKNIPCFSDLECSNRPGKTFSGTSKTIQLSGCSEMSKTSTIQNSDDCEGFKKPGRTCTSSLEQIETSSTQWNQSDIEKRNENETRRNDSDDHYSSKKEECDEGDHDGINIEEQLDGLENSLKGVKMYKAGIHLMQLASSIDTVMCSEKRPKRLQKRSSERLLDSIRGELKHLEEYILRVQKQLKAIKKQGDGKEERRQETHRRGSDFSDITRQLLQEQLKLFSSLSSAAPSPASSASASREPSLCSDTPDVLRHTDVMKLRNEMQQLRQDSVEQNASMKEEILGEVRAEIRKCFKEFLQPESS